MNKKLYRSREDKKLCGVCSGVAKYLGLDPTVVRLLWAIISLSGTGIVAYIIAAIVVPEEPADFVDID